MPPNDSPLSAELQTVLNDAGTVFFAIDLHGIVRSFNPAAEQLIGWSAADVVGIETPLLWHDAEEIAARAVALSSELGRTVSPGIEVLVAKVRDQRNEKGEWTYICKNGNRLSVQLAVSTIRDADGAITGYLGTTHDLTDRFQAEEERDQFFKLTHDMLGIASTSGVFKRVNPAFSRTLGWTPEELLSRPFFDFIHPDDQAATMREVEKLGSGQPTLNFENRYQCKDGTYRWLEWTSIPQPDGTLFASARDITQLKQTVDALLESRQNLEITLNSIGDGVIATDANRRITRINPIAQRMTGWTRAEAIGRPIDQVFQIIHEDTREPALIPVDDVLATGTIHGLANHTALISRDGTEWAIADSAAPIWDEDGSIIGVVLVFHDVSNERDFERELQQLNSDLECRVEKRTHELAQSERRHRDLLANLQGMAYRCRDDAHWTTEFVSDGCKELLGVEPAALTNMRQTYLELVHPDDRSNVIAFHTDVVACHEREAKSRQPLQCEYRLVLSDGRVKWILDQARRIYRQDGAVDAIEGFGTDITELRQTQKELATTHAMYESLGRVSPVGIVLYDADGKCVDVNQRWCEVSGIPLDEARGDGWHAAIHPEDREQVVRDWGEVTRDGNSLRSEYRLRRPSGETVWVISQGVALHDSDGNVTGYIRVNTDVTEHKQTEQALRLLSTSIAKLRGSAFYEAVVLQLANLLDCEMAFIACPDPKEPGNFVTLAISKEGELQANFSYPIAGTPCGEVGDRNRCVIPSGAREAYPDDELLVDHEIEAYVGVPFINAQGQQIGNVGVMSRRALTNPGNVEAITQLFGLAVAAEMERMAVEQRFSDLFEFAPDAVVITNQEGIIVEANRQVETMFGWTCTELVGQPVEVLMPPELRAGHPHLRMGYIESASASLMGSERGDLFGARKDGTVFPVEISLGPMKTSDGPLVAASVRDVSERQRIVGELRTIANELQQANLIIEKDRGVLADRVAERTADLLTANAELVRASQAKSDFLSIVSHELRTPLNGIFGMNELLLKTELNEQQQRYVTACSSSAKVLTQLVNDILDLSKIEAGKLEIDPCECDLEAFVYDVAEVMSHTVQSKGLAMHCRVSPNACVSGLCDDTRLRQILVNLIGNAVKFTSAGSVTIRLERVAATDEATRLRFEVSDTGVGIPSDRLDRLFKVFSQVDNSTTRQFGGTGLGLSICKQLVELMGGEIGVESQEGVGTTFWFEFDLETTPRVAFQDHGRRLLTGTRILVIAEQDRVRDQLAEALQSWHCGFEHVSSLREALVVARDAEAAKTPFQVVLVDCSVIAESESVALQELSMFPGLHRIGFNFSPHPFSREQLRRLGVRHWLNEPIRPSDLFDRLVSVFSETESPNAPQQDHVTPSPQPMPALSGHVLVAEDNRINQLYVINLLKHFGCTSDLAANGEKALAAVIQKRYDLVLMDCQMPSMDGFSATREIRAREKNGDLAGRVPIVALTANALKEDRQRCLEAGMDDYLSKPIEPETLRETLEKFLG